MSPSWLRFGSFELHQKQKNTRYVHQLMSYAVRWYFPELLKPSELKVAEDLQLFMRKSARTKEIGRLFLMQVVERTAKMIASWNAAGFVHGVLNTDNMSILGLTIDYGPFAFIDTYRADHLSNLSDDEKRYSLDMQRDLGQWNLKQFSDSMLSILDISTQIVCLAEYFDIFKNHQQMLMNARLGFEGEPSAVDETLTVALLEIMEMAKLDYNHFFRVLSSHLSDSLKPPASIERHFKGDKDSLDLFSSWWQFLAKRREMTGLTVARQRRAMKKNNPIQKAIEDAEAGDFGTIRTLRRILANPFSKDPLLSPQEQLFYSSPPPENHVPVPISCSS